jgi:hypothetical protein
MHGAMHPLIGKDLIAARHADLLRYRRDWRVARDLPRTPSHTRERLGWLLVEAGLRLAVPGQR